MPDVHVNAMRRASRAQAERAGRRHTEPCPTPAWWTDGAWADRDIIVVGGGPTADRDLVQRIEKARVLRDDLRVVAVSAAAAFLPSADVVVKTDRRFWEWARHGEYHRFDPAGHQGLQVWPRLGHPVLLSWLFQPTRVAGWEDGAWSTSLHLGLGGCGRRGGNSGLCALQIADLLGGPTSRVWLVGFDLRRLGDQQTWWHPGHPGIRGGSAVYDVFLEAFRAAAPRVRARVAHLTAPTRLDWWPVESLEVIGV